MIYVFWWNGFEFEEVKKFDNLEALKNLMADPVWDAYEMSYLAW